MKRVSKRVIRILSAIMTMLLLISSLNFPSYAKEEEDDLGVAYKVGDIIKFGHYEQDGNTSNGKEEIEWQILKVESDKVLVVSKYVLDSRLYDISEGIWETSSLRQWLNNDFKNAAFTEAEQENIPTVTLVNKDNPYYRISGGNNTNDQIFCLSLEEMESYFGNYSWYDSLDMKGYNQNLICTPTWYADKNGVYVDIITEDYYNSTLKDKGYTSDVIGRLVSPWWLRSPSGFGNEACYVYDNGLAGARIGLDVDIDYCGVRPALYISIVNPKSINLDKTDVSMYIGEEETLVANLTPEGALKYITWTSSNPEVATVTNGVVKAISAGKATITATTVNDLTATCEITVTADPSPYKVGDIIKFGHYEQDGDETNGKEEIEWEVLKVESNRVLVVSKYALDCKKYNETETGVTWETCTLRSWLNNDFKNSAFTLEEQAKIPIVNTENNNGTAGGNNTNDQIFCLSLEEVESYFGEYNRYGEKFTDGYNQNLICTPTQYAENNGAPGNSITESDYISFLKNSGYTRDVIGRRGTLWWLRSPSNSGSSAYLVSIFGWAGAFYSDSVRTGSYAVRPALYIKVLTVNPETITLNATSTTMNIGEEMNLVATITPDDVTEDEISWTSSKPEVATVTDGVVKAISAGEATITATTVNDLTATCKVTVTTAPYNAGDIIKFGHYEQDGNLENGKEEIEWEVLKAESGRVLVVSKYALDCKPFNTEDISVTWENCTLRSWLNNDFKNAAFTSEEQAKIPTVTVENKKHPRYSADAGNDTNDQIFCLSLEETEIYFGDYSSYGYMSGYKQNLICTPTQYAENNGAYVYPITEDAYNNYYEKYGYTRDLIGRRAAFWWLRSPASVCPACLVDIFGWAGAYDSLSVGYDRIAVRPALFIDISDFGDFFADIKSGTWQYKAAKAVYDKGYMTGTGTKDGKIVFSPNTDMNRTMFVQALYSMDGKPEVTYVQKFSDVKENAWYAKAVTWASNNGVVAGNPDGSFSINGKATREQMALMLYKYAVYKNYDVNISDTTSLDNFTDANKVDSWALTAVKWAVERGIISGKGNASTGYRIAPTEKATRIECAAMLNKFSEVYADAPKMGSEDLEEPLALPEEEIEDLPLPADETEDVIIDEDEDPEDIIDEEETEESEEDNEEDKEDDNSENHPLEDQ